MSQPTERFFSSLLTSPIFLQVRQIIFARNNIVYNNHEGKFLPMGDCAGKMEKL